LWHKGVEGSALRLPRFIRLGLTGEMENGRLNSPPFHRISHNMRWVAPQRCPIYAAVLLLTIFGRIIPFTLKNVHTPSSMRMWRLLWKYTPIYTPISTGKFPVN